MWARAEVVAHPYRAVPGCQGGDDCEHTDKTGVGLGFDRSNPVDDESPYEEQLLQTVRNLCAADPRVRDGHYFSILVAP